MPDMRPRVTRTKPVNLRQLADEAGAALCASDAEVVAAEGTTITQQQLEAAYAAHTANPDYGKPDEDTQLAAVRAKAQAVLAGSDTFTATQVQRILAHLVLRATR